VVALTSEQTTDRDKTSLTGKGNTI